MALLTDRKFIHFNRKSDFEALLNANAISDKQIVFLKDAQEIWTHGTYYGSVEQFLDETNKDSTNAISAAAVYKALADDEKVIAAALNDLNDKYTNLDSSKQDVISDLDTIRENAQSGASKVSNVQADWNATSGLAQILHKPDLSVYENKVTSVNGQTGDVEVVVPQSLLLKGITPQGHTLADAADSYYANELNNGEAGAWFISYSNGDILVKSSDTSKDQDGRVCLSSSWKSRLNYGGMTWANVGDILLVYKQSSLIVVYKVMSINEAGETRIGLMSPNDKIQVNKISNIEGNVNNLLGKIDKRLPYSTDSTNIGNAGNGAYTNVTAGRTNWLDTSTAGAAIKLGNLQIAIDNSGRLYSRNQTNNIWNVTNQLKTITETDLNNVFEPSVIGYATVTNGPSETGNYTVYTLTSSDYDGNGFRSILQIAINRNSGNQYMRTCFKKVDGSGTDFTSTDWKLLSPSVISVNGQTGMVNITIPSKVSDLTDDLSLATLDYVDDKLDDVLGISAAGVEAFVNMTRDEDIATGILTEIVNKAPKTNAVNGAPLSNAESYFYGTSTTAAATVLKEVSIPSITSLKTGQIIVVKPTITSTVANSTIKLNNFTAYPMRYNNAAITTSTNSIVWAANIPSIWVFDGTYWVFLGHGLDSNTTYSAMTQAEATTGTATTARTISAKVLHDTIEESVPIKSIAVNNTTLTPDANKAVNIDISGKQDTLTPKTPISIVQGTGSSTGTTFIKLVGTEGTDISHIVESTNNGGWEHAGNSGIPTVALVASKVDAKYTKPSTGIPKTDLASAVQTSLGKADSAIQGVKVNGTALTPDANKVVDVTIPEQIVSTIKVGQMSRSDVSGSGSLTIKGNVGQFPTVTEAGDYIVKTYMSSSTSNYTLTSTFGNNTYNITSSNGIINDLRQLTLNAGDTWSGSITTVSSSTTLSVVVYKVGEVVTMVGPTAVSNDYNDLDNRPIIEIPESDIDSIVTPGLYRVNQSIKTGSTGIGESGGSYLLIVGLSRTPKITMLGTTYLNVLTQTRIKSTNGQFSFGGIAPIIEYRSSLASEISWSEWKNIHESINTRLDDLENISISEDYEPSSLDNEDLELAAGDTYEEAFGKLEKSINDNEQITAAALTDLDSRINTLHLPQSLDDIPDGSTRKLSDYATTTLLATKQDTLVSGTNIKTINNESILGSGNITIQGGSGGGDVNVIETVKVNGTALTPDANKAVNIDLSSYDKAPLVIEVDDRDLSVPNGTYANITQALSQSRQVLLKVNSSDTYVYVPLVYDLNSSDSEYYFGAISGNASKSYAIDSYNTFFDYSETISINSTVVHKSGTETITGNKTFTGTVTLGSNAVATTPTVTDNDTSVATTAFVQNRINNGIDSTKIIYNGGIETIVSNGDNLEKVIEDLLQGVVRMLDEDTGNANQLVKLVRDQDRRVTATGFSIDNNNVMSVGSNNTTEGYKTSIRENGLDTFDYDDGFSIIIDSSDPSVKVSASGNIAYYLANAITYNHNSLYFPNKSGTFALTSDIPSAVTESTVSGWGFTKNTGTVTGITMNGSSKGTSGVVDLGTVATANNYVTGGSVNSSNGTISLNREGLSAASVTGLNTYVSNMISTALTASGGYDDTYVAKAGDTMTGALTVNAAAANTVNIIGGDNSSGNQIALNVGSGTHANMFQVFDDGSAHIKANGTLEVVPSSGQTGVQITSNAATDTALTTNGKVIANQFVKSGGTSNQLLRADGSVITFPAFSTADNGKVLSVVSGSLAWVMPTAIYSGTSAPDSNTGNNGDLYLQTS